jgi:alkanesulfonate monooxygenase SsuD/methylene tetrahydromethanopterin reductase-like flavin-dependent oxidoreductase (luciferase family)
MTTLLDQADFGWMLPSGSQRMPVNSEDYLSHIQQILRQISGHFHSAWIPDHLMEGEADLPEALVTLSFLAGQFSELFFGTIVISQSYRNPALLAKMTATFQHLSAGRFILGLGAGWDKAEYQAYGYDFPKASVRLHQMSETIQICKALWDPDQKEVTFEGEHYQIKSAACFPKPGVTPPVMVGGGGEKLTLRIVAQYADWWNLPGASPIEFAQKIKILERHCAEVGRSADDIRKTWMGTVSIAPTRQQAEAQLSAYANWPGDTILLGSPAEIRDQLTAYLALGVDYFILRFVDEPDSTGIELFQSQVLDLS